MNDLNVILAWTMFPVQKQGQSGKGGGMKAGSKMHPWKLCENVLQWKGDWNIRQHVKGLKQKMKNNSADTIHAKAYQKGAGIGKHGGDGQP